MLEGQGKLVSSVKETEKSLQNVANEVVGSTDNISKSSDEISKGIQEIAYRTPPWLP
ncbi:MAG: hypothetical protein GX238_01370 [Epulopiscium sp.]|nr:hypothetical protein [Candidatus Epulonipiscium sp.]